MDVAWSRTDVARGAAVLSVGALLAVLLWYLPRPGYSQSRLVLFSLIAGAAVLGGVGVLLRRFAVAVAGVVGLVLLGFWQAVLSVFILPVGALLLLSAVLDREESRGRSAG